MITTGIKNGSRLVIGDLTKGNAFEMYIEKRFNWFQKKMIGFCFGIHVEDYSDKEGENDGARKN